MSNPNVSYISPDKLIKDYQWDSLQKVARYSHGILLDIGCGIKPYKKLFRPFVNKYIGIDLNNNMADIKGDFLKLRIKQNYYDTVLCTQVLEHTPEPMKILIKIYKSLKKGGILILSVPFTGSIHEEPNDYYRFTKYGISYLIKNAGFKISEVIIEGNWVTAIGQEMIFYLEPSFNRFLLKYPKRLLQLLIQFIVRAISLFPEHITKSRNSNINYLVVAIKS